MLTKKLAVAACAHAEHGVGAASEVAAIKAHRRQQGSKQYRQGKKASSLGWCTAAENGGGGDDDDDDW